MTKANAGTCGNCGAFVDFDTHDRDTCSARPPLPICTECGESFDEDGPASICPECIAENCGEEEYDDRHRDDDDGRTYADPRDERDERRNR